MTYRSSITKFKLVFFVGLFAFANQAFAQGGCGSACLPLESLNVFESQVNDGSLRMAVTWQYAEFDSFLAGDDDVTNMGGNSAVIQDAAVFIDYGMSERFTVSLLLPYIKKEQQTNRFGQRVASGLGDVAIFGRYELLGPKAPGAVPGQLVSPAESSTTRPSISVGLGIKFPTGSIDEPGSGVPNLPPPFQNGTGATDLIGTVNYNQRFQSHSLFGNAFARLPLEENKRGYQFGNEFEIHFGGVYPLRFLGDKVDLTLSLDFLHGDHDHDNDLILPGRLRDGDLVLNTGGNFLDITPGFVLNFTRNIRAQVRVFIPVHEDWNGEPSRNVGQVAPDSTWQATLNYMFD
jgi:hypothetical protein